jgi:hypothetical protein
MIAIEEDTDQGFSALSEGCLRWECQTWERGATKPTHPTLEVVNGFWCCPKCGGSYGAAEPQSEVEE